MEKAKISAYQLFVLIVLFEIGSAILFSPGLGAKQNAWIAILLGLAGGLVIFLIYYRLYKWYPDIPFTSYVKKITGTWIGSIIAFFYILYFLYQASRILRDFGELLVTTTYTETPLFIINTLMIIIIMFAVTKGIEVIARVGELFFAGVYLLAILGFVLITFTGIVHLENLQPLLENGWSPVLKAVITDQTINFPFGEMVVFTMLLPYVNKQKKILKICLGGMCLSGINIVITSMINIAVLGLDILMRSPFPLYNTIRKVELGFFERLDIFFVLYLVIAGFFKITLYYYVAVIGTADLFKLKNRHTLNLSLSFLILISSITISSNYSEHAYEGEKIIPYYLHWPLQIIIPVILLIIAFLKKQRVKSNYSKAIGDGSPASLKE
ncbi:GerAB/ArcD/ProY family transporter [Bacillus sp. MRMR6]|uniref:GerAB/ArcD/ProY family transporter n=1 Tax=Bacillus sp. MRMR6 TaxID=1928617 RepID=UPI00095116A2|nr:GerAB/ArcD/ProY family transporter [Bacillus sp. MRMR6]OLS40712.1 spore gernimation protein KB [Bacillus sp. MRMR6]